MNSKKKQTNSGLSINILLLLSFAVAAVVPVGLLGIKVYNAALENSWREVKEKHQLLAENLAAPVTLYIRKHQSTLAIGAKLIAGLQHDNIATDTAIQNILATVHEQSTGFDQIYLFSANKSMLLSLNQKISSLEESNNGLRIGSAEYLNDTYTLGNAKISSVLRHPISGKPTIFIATALPKVNGSASHAILLAELSRDPIETLRRGIHFGQGGHSAIVDATGSVVAHPNPDWAATGKDLSHLDIIKSMMAGKTGVTEFFSPFRKITMVAGYASVPDLGWGIMVPQPKSEVESQINAILFFQLGWGLVGVLLALVLSVFLGRWITQPLQQLAEAGKLLSKEGFKRTLPKLRQSTPYEVQQLADGFGDAIHNLSISRAEVDELNRSLQNRVDAATNELRQANVKLSALARCDHLTKLSNRRHFEQTITNLATQSENKHEPVCLLLIDVDRFKTVNDRYGHAAGDMVLIQIAEVMERNMRQSDMSARYAGDEFVAIIHANLEIGKERAETIRREIAAQKFIFNDNEFTTTVSIGIIECIPVDHRDSVDAVLQQVDIAMYQAKNSGRDSVTAVAL